MFIYVIIYYEIRWFSRCSGEYCEYGADVSSSNFLPLPFFCTFFEVVFRYQTDYADSDTGAHALFKCFPKLNLYEEVNFCDGVFLFTYFLIF